MRCLPPAASLLRAVPGLAGRREARPKVALSAKPGRHTQRRLGSCVAVDALYDLSKLRPSDRPPPQHPHRHAPFQPSRRKRLLIRKLPSGERGRVRLHYRGEYVHRSLGGRSGRSAEQRQGRSYAGPTGSEAPEESRRAGAVEGVRRDGALAQEQRGSAIFAHLLPPTPTPRPHRIHDLTLLRPSLSCTSHAAKSIGRGHRHLRLWRPARATAATWLYWARGSKVGSWPRSRPPRMPWMRSE